MMRTGVAFALASVSFSKNDFPAKCGGKHEWGTCESTTDSAAILQTTMLIAVCAPGCVLFLFAH